MYKNSISLTLLALFSVGCSDSSAINEKDLRLAIAEYLSTDRLCIWTGHVFPVNVADGYLNQTGTNAFKPLVDAGVLNATRTLVGRESVTRYELTKEGESLARTDIPSRSGIKGTKFCPVQVEVVEILNYTIPNQGSENQITTVDYKYQISNVAKWGTAAVLRNNRLLEEMVQKKGQLFPGKNTLVRTKNGWKAR